MAINFLNRNKQVVGLDIGSSTIKDGRTPPAAQGGLRTPEPGDGRALARLHRRRRDHLQAPGLGCHQPDFTQQTIKNRRVATSISGHSVIVKKIALPVQSDEDLAESIRWEAEQYIPFDIADVNLDYQVLGENATTGNLDVLLVAVKKEKITDHTSVITMAGKNPVVVDVDAFALQNAYEVNYEPATRTTVALLDIGASIMTINIVAGTDFLFTRDVGVGGHQYTDFIQKEFNLSFAQAQSAQARGGRRRDRPVRSAPHHRLGHRNHLPRNPEDLRFLQVHHHDGPHRPHAGQRRRRRTRRA